MNAPKKQNARSSGALLEIVDGECGVTTGAALGPE